jgi:hypothetical protein
MKKNFFSNFPHELLNGKIAKGKKINEEFFFSFRIKEALCYEIKKREVYDVGNKYKHKLLSQYQQVSSLNYI